MPENHGDNPDMRGAPWTSWSELTETENWGWFKSIKILLSVA